MTLVTIARNEPHATTTTRVPALLQAGFRPFFLLAAVVSALAIAAWIAVLRGVLMLGPVNVVDVHVHEMIFGFTSAVIAGFLLTAVRNWTNVNPAPPPVLAALVALFVVGRIGVALEALGIAPGASAIELLLLPALALAIAVPIVKTRNKRNAGVVALVVALALVDVAMHVAAWRGLPLLALSARNTALLVPCVLIALIGGRVMPMFTRNVVSAAGVPVRNPNAIDVVSVVAAALVVPFAAASPFFDVVRTAEPFVDAAAGALLFARMRGWASTSIAVWRRPILGVLHVGYAAVALGLLLRAFPNVVPPAIAAHVLAVGGIGVMCVGMMTRVALGHTGRPLVAPRLAVVAYALVVAAAIARIVAAWRPMALDVAATLFATAMAAFFVSYARVLVAPRVDGKPG